MNLERATVRLDTLEHWPGNARRGDTEAVAASLEAHGQYRPLLVQKSTRRVIAGNHTMRALGELGRSDALVDFIDVDDEQGGRINLVDNRTQDLASYDNTALAEQLAGLGGDFDGTGYDQADYDALLDTLGAGDSDELIGPEDAPDDAYGSQFGVIVMCRSEDHQQTVFDILAKLRDTEELDALELKVVTV